MIIAAGPQSVILAAALAKSVLKSPVPARCGKREHMTKLPVGSTIRHAYSFTFGELGTIIGLCWLPLVLIAILQFLPYAFGGDPMAAPENAAVQGRHGLEG